MQTEGRFGNSKVVTTVMSNLGLYKALDAAGIGYEKTDVGDKYVAENMRANGHLIGGEQSGHIIFGKYANTGDGLLTAIKLMQVMLDRKKKLSELAAPVREYPQQLTNVEVDDKDATLSAPAVVAAVQGDFQHGKRSGFFFFSQQLFGSCQADADAQQVGCSLHLVQAGVSGCNAQV